MIISSGLFKGVNYYGSVKGNNRDLHEELPIQNGSEPFFNDAFQDMIPDGQISLQCQANYVIANPMSKAFPASVPSSASNKRNMLSSKQTQMRTPTSDLHNSFLVRNR